jgi:putative transposase
MEKREIREDLPEPSRDGMDLYLLLEEYFDYYNHERRHQSIEYQRPKDVYRKAA